MLGSVVEGGSTITFRMLERSDFVDEQELAAFDFIKQHYRAYGELPLIETIEEECDLAIPETPEHVDYYLQKLHDRTVYNGVREEFSVLRDSLKNVDVTGMMTSARNISRICTPYTGQQAEIMTLAEARRLVKEAYRHNHANIGLTGIPTGHRYLNEETGGYQNGDLIVWVARPGVGKTHLLIHGARAAREAHKSVLFVSMEMPLTQIAARYVAHAAGLDPDKIRKGKLSFWAERTLSDGLAELGGATNFHLFAGNFKKTSDDVDVLIQELAPDIVYIDGMYLLHPSQVHGRAGRYERAAYLTDEIKRMTLMRDRPIVCSSQFGRGANKGGEDGSLENIGYTDAIGTHSSIVIGVKLGKKRMVDIKDQKEDGEIYTKGQKETYPYRHHEIMKGREGETGEFATHFAFAPTNFSQVPVETAIGRRVDDEEAGRPSVDHMQ